MSERVITFQNLLHRSFTPHKRIGWKELAVLWNKNHPYDTMTPDRLRTEFYRSIRDKRVQREFFDRQDKEFAKFATEGLKKEAAMFAEGLHRTLGEDFANFKVGEPHELKWLDKLLKNAGWQPVPHARREANYMSLLTHRAIAKEKEVKAANTKTKKPKS